MHGGEGSGLYVDSQSQLVEICERAREAGRLAIDVEFIRERSYYPKLALVQIGVGDTHGLVDPLGDLDLAPIDALVSDPAVIKVLHAATQDLEIFYMRSGQLPRNVFDTQVAAALLGHGQQISYGNIVSQVLGVAIVKGESFTDWMQRPLAPEQERYALEDVRYLLELHDRLSQRLAELERSEWLTEECRRYEDESLYVQNPRTVYTRVRRSGVLNARGLAVLRELAAWREEAARERDRPRRQILKDEVMVELSRLAPTRMADLRRFRGLHPRLLERSGQDILEAIRVGTALPEERLPRSEGRRRLEPDQLLAVDLLDACLRALSSGAQISPALIGTRADIEQLVARHRSGSDTARDSAIFRGWRRALVGEELLAVLEGRMAVYLDPETGAPRFVDR